MKTNILTCIKTLAIVAVISTMFISCFPPKAWEMSQQAYSRGDIESSVRYAAQTLREKPGYEKAINFIQGLFPSTYEQYYERAKRAERTNDWDEAFRLFNNIQTLSDILSRIPPQTILKTNERVTFPIKNVRDEINVARESAAEMHYQGAILLENGERHRDAARSYSKALEYVRNYKDAAERYENMRQAAIQRVAVLPFENLSGQTRYGPIGEVMSQYVINALMRNPSNMEFMEIFSRDRLERLLAELELGKTDIINASTAAETGQILGLHAFVFGSVTSISTHYPNDTITRYPEERIIRKKDAPDEKVSAVVFVTTRRGTVTVTCSYQIIDVSTGRMIDTDIITAKVEVEIEFGRYTGDSRAFSADRKLTNLVSAEEKPVPPPAELVQNAVQKASSDLANNIARKFR